MYSISLNNLSDIRMGSPYNSADITISGGFVPPKSVFQQYTFQDKYAISTDGQTCFLIQWISTSDHGPAFRIWKISNQDKTVACSDTFSGACSEILFIAGPPIGVSVLIWEYQKDLRTEFITKFERAP